MPVRRSSISTSTNEPVIGRLRITGLISVNASKRFAASRLLATVLIAKLPELGKLTPKEIRALVGEARFNRDSGTLRGKRRIKGGRAQVRTILYMATLSATIHNPTIRTFYSRLVSEGKHRKVALTASMRKMIVVLNAMVRDGTYWGERDVKLAA